MADSVLGPVDGAGLREDVREEGEGDPTGRGRSGGRSDVCGGGLRILVTEVRGRVRVRCLRCARCWDIARGMDSIWTLSMFGGHRRLVFARGAGRIDG